MTQLYVLSGPERGRFFKLREGENFVGRSLDNDIRIEDRTVSRKHVKIVMRKDRCFITDLKSRNGTFFRGDYIEPGLGVELEEGVPIAIGMTVICLGEACNEQVMGFQDTVEISREAIERSATFVERRSETNQKKSEFLAKVSSILVAGLPTNETLEKILDHVFDLLNRIDRGTFILVDPETREIEKTISKSSMPDDESSVAYSRRVVKRVIEDRKPLAISDVQTEEDRLFDTLRVLKIECAMCVPMIFGSRIFGVLYVDSLKRPYGFREEDLALLMELGQQIGLLLEKSRFASEMSKIADVLTLKK
ncbi:MAG: FHA domain-containing protein [Desulfobacteraceae bacterium]